MQLRGHALLVGVGSSKRLELADELRVATERELGVDPLDLGGQPRLVHTRERAAFGPFENDVGERGTAPERERPQTQRDSLLELTRAGLVDQALELQQVEAVGSHPKLVARRARHHNAGAKCLTQGVDVALHELLRRGRRPLAPELVHEARAGDGLVRVQEQHAKERALLGRAEPHRLPPVENLERAENPELHNRLP